MLKLNIRTKLFFLVILILIPLISLQLIRISQEYQERIQNELKSNEELAEAISTSFTNYIDEIWIQQDIIGSYITMRPDLSSTEIQSYLLEAQSKQETIKHLTWISPETVVIASSQNKLAGKKLGSREYLKRIFKGDDRVISNLELSFLDNEPIIVLARAIKKDGELLGIIAGIVDIEKLSARLPGGVNTGTRFGLIDNNGMVVYRSDVDNIIYEKRKIPDDTPPWKALNGEVVRTIKSSSWLDGSERMGIDFPVGEIGWDCFVTTSYESAMSEHYDRLKNDLLILIAISFLSVISAYWLSTKFVSPLYHLKEAVEAMKTGDYSVRTNIRGYDELGTAVEAFDSMVETVERYDKAKSQFFTNLSHEFKTPLNVILASTQLMGKINPCDCSEHEKVTKQNNIIKQNCYRLIRMVNNLIDVSKYESGYFPIKLSNCNIVNIVEEITLSVVKFAEMKGIEVLFDTDVEEKVIACDPDILERVMLNLLSNALKFTDSNGNITVNVLDKQDMVEISVKDTGIGIPKDKLDLVFDRFEQVDTSLCRNHEGSGIGLSLVKTLVEAHNGSIKILSELGKGTEVIVSLPATSLPETENSIVEEISENSTYSLIERVTIEFSDIYELRRMDD